VVPGAKNQKRKIKKLKMMKTKPLTAEEIRDIEAKVERCRLIPG